MKIIVNFKSTGLSVNEFNYDKHKAEFLKYYNEQLTLQENGKVSYSTDNGIHMIRALIKENLINKDYIEFKYISKSGEKFSIYCDQDGRLSEWPDGFCDLIMKLSEVLIG